MNEGLNTTFTLNLVDILVCLFCAFTTSSLISWLQKTPSRPVGIIDFILGNIPRHESIKSIGFVLLTPMIIGFLVGFMEISSPISGGVGTGLGAFFSVSTAFLNPKLLAPPLRKQIPKARRVYLGFVTIYTLLGLSGAYITNALPDVLNNQSVLSNLFSSAIWGLFFIFGSIVFFFIRTKYKHAFPLEDNNANEEKNNNNNTTIVSPEKLLSPHLKRMIRMEAIRSFEEAAIYAEQQSKDSTTDFADLISQEISRQLPEIVQMVDLAHRQDSIRRENNPFYDYYVSQYYEGSTSRSWDNREFGDEYEYYLYYPYYFEDARGNIKWHYPRFFS
ncbi:hypothetical protein [Brevibacillus formosus]|uniref:hypothetical protein n=1 Tax=Brevibacillus formosus TaxID=54913 RepID=UPI003F1B606F